MNEEIYDAFISYSHKDIEFACLLANSIRKKRHPITQKSLRVFLDIDTIKVGDNWITVIEDALQKSRCVIPVYSEDYFKSKTSSWELIQKQIIDIDAQENLILPCKIQDCNIPPRLKHIQYVNFCECLSYKSELFESKINELVSIIKGIQNSSIKRNVYKSEDHLPILPYYIYISDSKIDMLSSEIIRKCHGTEGSISRYNKLSEVIDNLYRHERVGGMNKPYFNGEYDMQWGVIDWGVSSHKVSCSVFFSLETDPMILLFGSSYHIVGNNYSLERIGGFGYSGSNLPGILRIMGVYSSNRSTTIDNYFFIKRLQEKSFHDIENKPQHLNFPKQRLNFIAKNLTQIFRPSEEEFATWLHDNPRVAKSKYEKYYSEMKGNIVVGTPIYVAMAQ